MQRQQVITSGSDESIDDHADQMLRIKKDNPIVKIFSFGEVSRKFEKEFMNKKLTALDRRLLKGFYINNKQEMT